MIAWGCGGGDQKASAGSSDPPVPPSLPAPPPPPPPPPGTVPPIGHVALLVLENQKEDAIFGNDNLPYLTSLARQNGYAAGYYADVHPSLGNYFFLTTGQVISNDLNFDGVVDVDNLIREIVVAGKTWKAYAQAIPSVGYLEDGPYPYAKTHNPFAYFADTRNNPSQAQNMVPFEQFATDMANGQLPNFIYIAPSQVYNMHDCPPNQQGCTNDQKLAAGDRWVQENVGPLLADPAFQQDGLLIITWDESWDTDSDHGGGHVLTILAGSKVKQQFVSNTFYQHESVLHTICEALQVPCMSAGATAPDMGEFFVGNN